MRRYFVTHASVRCARCGVKLSARILAPSAPHRLTRLIPRCSSPVGSELPGPGGCSLDGFIATIATYIIFRYFVFFPSVFDFDFRAGGPFFSTLCIRVVRVVVSLLRHGLTAVKATSIRDQSNGTSQRLPWRRAMPTSRAWSEKTRRKSRRPSADR